MSEEQDKDVGFSGIGHRINNLDDDITPQDKAVWEHETEKVTRSKPADGKQKSKPKRYAPQSAGFTFRVSFAKVFWGIIAIGIIVSIFSQSEKRETNNTISNPTSTQSFSPSSVEGEFITDGQYRCTQYHHNRAEELKPNTFEMQEMDRQQRILNSEEEALVLLQGQIETDYVDYYSQSSVDQHNMLVDSYNSRLAILRGKAENLEIRIDKYNAQVDVYNNYLMTNCRKAY